MTSPADVRVGIVSWNTASLLARCLDALPDALGGMRAEVVVVDNASNDDSVLVAERHRSVEVRRRTTNIGYARAMNDALRGSHAPFLVALNPDTVPLPGSLATLVERLATTPEVGLAAPRLISIDRTTQHSVYRFPSLAVAAVVGLAPRPVLRRVGAHWWLEGASDHNQCVDIDWAIGAVHVIRRAALAGAAPYDERWFMYAEDIELCWRLRQGGWRRRLEGDIAVIHVGNAAGAQRWGEQRELVHLAAARDWLARDRGGAYARVWSLINAVGAARRVPGAVVHHRGGRRLATTAWWHLRGVVAPRTVGPEPAE